MEKYTTSTKTITLQNKFIDNLRLNPKIKYQHINLLTYFKDRATLEEGGIRFIKTITLNEINNFINGDVKCKTAKKLLFELINLGYVYVSEDKKITPKAEFCLTLDDIVTKSELGGFTIIPESLLHLYPLGISTYMSIRKYHSEMAKISIPQIQKYSKVSNRNIQLKILNQLEEYKFISIGKGGYSTANTYKCMDHSKIDFTRMYNKYKRKTSQDSTLVTEWGDKDFRKDKELNGCKNRYREYEGDTTTCSVGIWE